jgi:serine protease Do
MNGYHSVFCVAKLFAGLLALGLVPRPVLGQSQAESLSSSFRKATERIAPSVVTVRPLGPQLPLPPGPIGPVRPFEAMPRFTLRADGEREPVGSGVVIDADRGYILTNDHVLVGASQAAIVVGDGRERITSQIRRDPGFDLAVLVIDPAGLNLATATWGDPSSLHPGDWVLSVGRGSGSAPSLSAGIFSTRRRGVSVSGPADEWLETDAAVNSHNSGGPLINLNAEVVGINTAQAGRRGPIAGMGFALPADRARRIAADLVAFGQVRRAFLGVQIEQAPLSASDRPRAPGSVVIASVTPGTPAAEAGLRPGDVVVSIGGRPVDGIGMIQESIETAAIGEDLMLTIERTGRRQDITVRPKARSAAAAPTGGPGPRVLPETRRDALRGRIRSRVIPRDAQPSPAPATGEDTPLSLDPVPKPTKPGNAPTLEPPKNQPQEEPR